MKQLARVSQDKSFARTKPVGLRKGARSRESKSPLCIVGIGGSDGAREADPKGEWRLRAKDGTVKTIVWRKTAQQVIVPGWAAWGIGLEAMAQKKLG